MKHFFVIVVAFLFSISLFADEYQSTLERITGAQVKSTAHVTTKQVNAPNDGQKDALPAFRKAIQRLQKSGGGTFVVTRGVYLLNGPLELISNLTLQLEEGATIKFSPNPAYYPLVSTSWEGTWVNNYSPFIRGYQLSHVKITGKGTIDGNAATTFSTWKQLQEADKQESRRMNHEGVPKEERNFGHGHYLRPQLMQFYKSSNVTIEGVFITNSPFWCIHLLECDNVILRSLRYSAKLINNDGIDPECSSNVLIEDIDFDNGDDNVAIKSGRDHDGRSVGKASHHIIIRNCRFKGLHGVVIGSEMSAGVHDVWVVDCVASGYCKRGIYIKTNPDRGGFISNIYVRNTQFQEVEDLLYITSMYAGEGSDNDKYTDIHDIHVENLTCEKARHAAVVIQGVPQRQPYNLSLSNVQAKEALIGLSINNTKGVVMNNCNIGGVVNYAPTTAK